MSIKPYQRSERVANQIHHAVATIMQQHKDVALWQDTTITSLEVSKDLKHAKIFVSSLKDVDSKKYIQELNDTAKLLRQLLARSLNLRVTPELRFFYDRTITEGLKVDQLINAAMEKVVTE